MSIWETIKQLANVKALFKAPNLPRPSNSGVLDPNPREGDYIVGATSPILYAERLRDGNWTPYAFDEEPQSSSRGDSMSCVSHSAVNIIEAQEFFITGRKVHYSKRWIAKMSETTRDGNYLWKVADTIRKYGMVLEEDYPAPDNFTWDEYHTDIPSALKDKLLAKGQEWLKRWKVQYEWLQITDPNLDYHLKHAPIQVVIPGHAVSGIYSPDQLITYLDSYSPWQKRYPVGSLQSALKLILTPTTIEAKQFSFLGSPEMWIAIPLDSMQRLEAVKDNLPTWLPDYYLNASKVYQMPIKKPF